METLRITPAAARVNAGLTQDEAAKRLHVTKVTLIKWEKGITEPRIEQARAMSREYGIPIDNISFGP